MVWGIVKYNLYVHLWGLSVWELVDLAGFRCLVEGDCTCSGRTAQRTHMGGLFGQPGTTVSGPV